MIVSINSFAFTKVNLVIILITFASVLGCGLIPQGSVNAMSFMATGFTLPAEMAYSENVMVQNLITSISRSREAAITVVTNLIMNAVNDVLQEQGRNASLPDPLISVILQQLNVTIEYTPLNCPTATNNPMNNVQPMAMTGGCFIIDGEVKSLCMMQPGCVLSTGTMVNPVPAAHRTITGRLETTNIIMANWSKQMWQSILNRVYRRLLTGQFGKYFNTAIVTVNN